MAEYNGDCRGCGAPFTVEVEGAYYPGSWEEPPEYPTYYLASRACDEDCGVNNEAMVAEGESYFNQPYEGAVY